MPLRASALPSGSHMRIYRRAAVRQPDRLQRPRHAAVAIAIRRAATAVADRLRRGARPDADDDGRRAGEVAVRQPRASVKAQLDRHRPAGATRSRYDRAKATIPTAASRWTSGTATSPARQRLYARLRRDQGAESDRAVRRRAPALRRRSEDGFHQPAIGDRRRRVHQHRRSRRPATAATCRPIWEATKQRQPAHQISQQRDAATSPAPRRPSSMRADFKILDKVTVPDLPIKHRRIAGRAGGKVRGLTQTEISDFRLQDFRLISD